MEPSADEEEPVSLETEPVSYVPEPVQDEERLLSVVVDTASRVQTKTWDADEADAFMIKLRDQLQEARLPEDRASILEQMDRMARLKAQQANHREGTVNISSPYFGHMRLHDDDGTRRDILIGRQTWVKDGVRIVDWRNAPISQVFYQREEGEDYEIPIAGRLVSGEVSIRRTVSIRDGKILRVGTSDETWVKEAAGWRDVSTHAPKLRGGAGRARRPDVTKPILGEASDGRAIVADKHLPEIASLLDREQFELITKPEAGVVAIQGSAGSGKTTVALHRVAYLNFQKPGKFSGSRSLVVVFSLALARYISRVLPALGVDGVQVATFDDWASQMRIRLYPRTPKRYSDETPLSVSRFKLHSALLPMLEEGYLENDHMKPFELFEELMTNRGWIRDGLERHAPGVFSEEQQNTIHRWCSDQHFIRVEGKGHRDYEVPMMDREDDAILLYLHQLIRGPLTEKKGKPVRYAQLVVDEAQDLSPIELKMLLDTVEKQGAVTLAGDTAQRVMEDNDFESWGQVLAALGLDNVKVSPLKVTYRSTAAIMELAHHILGPLAPAELPLTSRDGVEPELFRFKDRGECFTFLADAVRRLQVREPHASVAVLAAKSWQADQAYAALSRTEIINLSRVRDHDFSFEPGVEVTDIRQAKGLEFDYVVVIDCDLDTFPENENSRHVLHVGVTRAAHQLWLLCVGTPSRLLPEDILTTTL
ncbi:MAG: ATP-binding domain-containing protein [Myxococcota bacterium]|nr:ATP-binding domain-containing protein [Myxococcota bacterium]